MKKRINTIENPHYHLGNIKSILAKNQEQEYNLLVSNKYKEQLFEFNELKDLTTSDIIDIFPEEEDLQYQLLKITDNHRLKVTSGYFKRFEEAETEEEDKKDNLKSSREPLHLDTNSFSERYFDFLEKQKSEFINQPPRKEDLRLYDNLEREIKQRESEIEKIRAELKATHESLLEKKEEFAKEKLDLKEEFSRDKERLKDELQEYKTKLIHASIDKNELDKLKEENEKLKKELSEIEKQLFENELERKYKTDGKPPSKLEQVISDKAPDIIDTAIHFARNYNVSREDHVKAEEYRQAAQNFKI